MAKYASRPAIRDSFDEEDVSDDVDDEVFIRDGRNGYKMDEENGVKKPLMPPRRRQRHKYKFAPSGSGNASVEPVRRCKMFLAPCCYGLAALSVLLGLLAVAVLVTNYFSMPLSRIQFWIGNTTLNLERKVVPCNELEVKDVWVRTFPKFTSETAVRLNDVNHDGIMDIILGYGTGLDGRNVPDFVCTLYFQRDPPCLGGIVALDGQNGEIIWQHWTHRPVFSVDCGADLTADDVKDCLIGGKGGLLHVVNGHDGSLVWHLEDQLAEQPAETFIDVYSAQYIPDVDDDGVIDIISAHTVSDSTGSSIKGHLIIVSGVTGRILRMIEMPGGSESYYAPQLIVRPDGEKVILIGTGGTAAHSWGGLHAIPLSQLAATDKVPFRTLITSDSRGVLSPPVIMDINEDGTEDFVVSLFNSTVVAINGKDFTTIWNYTFPNSQTFSPPTPGYFNDDAVPDLLVKYQSGPDFPVYYYSEMNILDGKTGLPLLNHSVIDSVGSQMGGFSVSMEGFGNDWFLYWTADCVGHEGSKSPYSFAKGSSTMSQSQADICRLRFNSSMTASLRAISRLSDIPGFTIYSTDGREAVEYNNTESALDEAGRYLSTHPDFWSKFGSQENVMKPAQSDSSQAEVLKPESGNPPLYENSGLKEDQMKGLSSLQGRNGKGVETEEFEEPDYSRAQPHQILKHHKPYGSISDPRKWHVEDPSKNYGPLYGSRPSDNLDQDYESSPRFGSEYNNFMTDSRNEREGAPQTAPNFDDIFHRQLRAGRRLKRSDDTKYDKAHENVKRVVSQFKDSKIPTTDLSPMKSRLSSSFIPKGIYPTTSTGSLAPPLSGPGIDLILVSYWIPPSDRVQILTEKDTECVKQGIARATAADNDKFANMDPESLELAVTAECLYERFATSSSVDPSSPSNDGRLEPHPGILAKVATESASTYDALNLRLGQLTVYRFNIQCKCSKSKPGNYSKILPFSAQSWPSFMGHNGKGYFSPRS